MFPWTIKMEEVKYESTCLRQLLSNKLQRDHLSINNQAWKKDSKSCDSVFIDSIKVYMSFNNTNSFDIKKKIPYNK